MITPYAKEFITQLAYEKLVSICLDAKPLEACGILASSIAGGEAGGKAIVDTVIPITNTHIDPTHSFTFDPSEWTAAYYSMQKNRQSLVGLFHSHPRTDAIPSSSDSEGFLPASELSYWIVSLRCSEKPEIKPYRRIDGQFIPLELVLA
ncbi:proteasome lid subunit RPN8/RPN11 [Paenibacillus endophyticus]|uniref:Proteasome lid subunit RPN8/RPN11 n=1 Tax=Paenibacillus endophyticus TaxID=1294268 RepID=A0A7W5C6T2_9BACL|nr:M67 family metallopeptidase [Paenibacillus endophyticus]MBB3151189.1 proteasome lid subunit RPN8/RPN11 [Paenibacillus endophyticus]